MERRERKQFTANIEIEVAMIKEVLVVEGKMDVVAINKAVEAALKK